MQTIGSATAESKDAFFSASMCTSGLLSPALDMAAPDGPLTNAIWNDNSRMAMERVFREGMFKSAPEIAEALSTIFDETVQEGASEVELVDCLKNYVHTSGAGESIAEQYAQDEVERVQRRVSQLVKGVSPPESFIDVGCGTGTITAGLAERWHLPPEKVFALDVFDRIGSESAFTSVALTSDGLVPVGVKAELGLLLMVLHHEANPAALLQSLYEALPENGHLVIREHDAADNDITLFLEAFDRFYFSVLNGFEGVPQPANYQSAGDWVALCESVGFKLEELQYPEPDSPMRPVHIILRKAAAE